MGRQTTRRKPGDLPFFLINIGSSGKKIQRKNDFKKSVFVLRVFDVPIHFGAK
jgi:hypothetical protein